jgi:hypothetical protein
MTPPPNVDQELLVHLYAPLGGARARTAYRQVKRLWAACHDQMGMTQAIAGYPVSLPERPQGLPADGLVAALEDPAGVRQALLRRIRSILNLSVSFPQPAPEGLRPSHGRLTPVQFIRLPPQRRMGWADFAHIWARTCETGTDAMLGEARIFLARTPPGETGIVSATAELGESLDPLLPYHDDRPYGWWHWGSTTTGGYGLWDTRPVGDTSRIREIVLFSGSDNDKGLNTWAWSDSTAKIPPFAEYLMHAAQLRAYARLFEARPHDDGSNTGTEGILAELSLALSEKDPETDGAAPLRSCIRRLKAEETRLSANEVWLAHLRMRITAIRESLSIGAETETPGNAEGVFGADEKLAQRLIRQIDNELEYFKGNVARLGNNRILAMEELTHARPTGRGNDLFA